MVVVYKLQKYEKKCLPLHILKTSHQIVLLYNKKHIIMKKGIVIIVALVALVAIWGVSVYNGLVTKQEGVEKAVGNVQTAYQQRADLIPNLVATVKNYAEYEAGTLTAVVEARAKATQVTLDANNLTEENIKAFQAAQDQMSGALSRLLVTVEQYPDLKANQNYRDLAVLVNNPTYYGICSDLRSIVKLAHEHGMLCLADEAHGTHFYFGEDLPVSAMEAGADMASVSMHKSGGSLTQSSFLLAGPNVHAGYVRQIINLTQTTSASYLLMSSLDISRRNLALRGDVIFREVRRIAEYARAEINSVGGYYAFGPEMINGDSIFDFDPIKLSVHTLDIGMAGIEVYDLLRDDYDIQIEFGDIGNILAYLSIGDRIQEVERLVSALAEIRRRYQRDKTGMLSQEYIAPQVVASPQEAFYAQKESLPIEQTEGRVCSEFVMCYPPGIPILAPGERITKDILNYILYAKEKGCSMTGPEDPNIERLNVLV